jgi:hypothetical protein
MARETSLTMKDMPSHLSYAQARKLLGEAAVTLRIGLAAEASRPTEALKGMLSECMERTEDCGWNMTVRFKDDSAIETLAGVLAALGAGSPVGRKNE